MHRAPRWSLTGLFLCPAWHSTPARSRAVVLGSASPGARRGRPSAPSFLDCHWAPLRSRPSGTSSLFPLPGLRESPFLTPTRPLGLGFYKMDLSFYKRQKEPLAQAALAFCLGRKIPEAKTLQRAGRSA